MQQKIIPREQFAKKELLNLRMVALNRARKKTHNGAMQVGNGRHAYCRSCMVKTMILISTGKEENKFVCDQISGEGGNNGEL